MALEMDRCNLVLVFLPSSYVQVNKRKHVRVPVNYSLMHLSYYSQS